MEDDERDAAMLHFLEGKLKKMFRPFDTGV